MSEKKYKVRLYAGISYYPNMNCCELADASVYLTKDVGNPFEAYPNKIDCFTKSELAEIMDGALYKQTDSLPFEWLYSFESLKEKLGWEFNETIDKWEYTNPLIELVPMGDGE